jgi:hypothetical protein
MNFDFTPEQQRFAAEVRGFASSLTVGGRGQS